MGRRHLEVADVVRAHRADLEQASGGILSGAESRVLNALAGCRTDALGGHVERCDHCGHQRIAYNSCRNRHCPKCQGSARREWVAERETELLPVEYFHVVFTIPHELALLAFRNKKVVYEILFRAAAGTLRTIGSDPKHLGAQLGVLALLHTWGQTLEHHPHVHCVVTGGGLSPDQSRWISCRPGFFLPVRVLSRLFRARFLGLLKRAHEQDKLTFGGRLAGLEARSRFRAFLAQLRSREWVVYSKPPFGGPARVLKYLGRYTHRVAIANNRIVAFEDGRVSFLWKDYAHDNRQRVMTLGAVEFLRRFLRHILPKGFVRIRHYGFLANRHREERLALCRKLLAAQAPEPHGERGTSEPPERRAPCPVCRNGAMILILRFEAGEQPALALAVPALDTS